MTRLEDKRTPLAADNVTRLEQERDALSGQVSRLAGQLAEQQIRNSNLQEQVAQLEKERDMAYHAYDKLREELLSVKSN